ncbi:hypothetical protein [Sulfolobus acidocaldarius]|uniref:Uncharacterized protein n=4 Tax=Sulfolobus acidocaldarius TaxID=2285 RepID=Q4J821_SULAC|nr:hypothetical protein [Sulfolobus acidocaldarius]AAY81060.1 hypothetical protein Saci_1754 [Sulfolobus acidocaldarius DSM 639]AGE71667.1 hypothetical protein SacN8_08535 [Sulfolobus acidocaldarius N8]AGE73940.1 hypothetical protein SacRon12I_08545 [Sulfolobus acidocaldarius Ron12/I]ALU30642.1 hypothetical protein ATY89_09360 [Sulfolobus acidocaldarius]ALU32726.1 hypothetical protein ATZ20_00770 [Sulfolobus acidocaldarius]
MKRENVIIPVLIVLAVLIIGTSGFLVGRNPFISSSAVSSVLGGSWFIQSFHVGSNTTSETLYDSSGDVLIVVKYTFPSVSQASDFFYSNALSSPQSVDGYLVSSYTHGLSESLYALKGNSVYYISYIGASNSNLPSLTQLISLISS